MAFTTYAANELLDHAFGVGAFTMPASLHLALFTTAPTDAYTSGSPTGVEVSTGGYARQTITFAAAAARAIGDNSAEAFTASGANYGTVVAIGIFDAATNGNLLWWDLLDTSRTVNDTDTLNFATGSIDGSFAASS